MAETAKKKDPAKWARAKAKARKKMGGHSARAMQLATKYYKKMGGRYAVSYTHLTLPTKA